MYKLKTFILNLSIKKIYNFLFLSDVKKTGYYSYLTDLYFQFLLNKFPELNKNEFEKSINELITNSQNQNKDITTFLYDAFEPNYKNNLNNYYKLLEKQIFFRFLEYSINPKLIKKKYSDIYDFAFEEINKPLEILEIGGGVCHGLIYNLWKKKGNFYKNLIYIEADMLHAEFTTWFCEKYKIPLTKKIFPASKTPTITGLNYNFVFAKDIFEHLDNPETLINELCCNNESSHALLCLDLEHKGPVTTQHINPNLPVLKEILFKNNFKVIKKFGDISVWKKNI